MIPWQIYADYLEDRGWDTRLFRLAEVMPIRINILKTLTINKSEKWLAIGNGNALDNEQHNDFGDGNSGFYGDGGGGGGYGKGDRQMYNASDWHETYHLSPSNRYQIGLVDNEIYPDEEELNGYLG